ncbi:MULTISPECIES: hypothetical protein [Xanthomonas]|uniref:hypothetical protein n=1 Tax=Xanthomonas TaxID=338 RepID=UPI0011C4494D|nr:MULTISPECIES: hypothetical protein [Xanthomonas]CAD1796126.1 hypothetical protein XSP_003542 [Xanthomonas sp. CPBF 426]CAG2095720.1 hypothetical protein XCY_003500 [Xanthomonas euroxanthea]
MAEIICPSCKHIFNPNSKKAYFTRATAAVSGGVAGALIGKGIGIAGRGFGMAATIPLAVILAVTSWQTTANAAICPKCKNPFKT